MDSMVKLLTKFKSRITTAIDADDLSIVLESVTDIPVVPFMGVLDVSSEDAECVWVTAVSTFDKTLTVTRAHRGTTAVAHAVGVLFHFSEVDLADLGHFEVWETAGETGRPLESKLITDVLLGSYANGMKGYVDCATSGGSVGLLSGVNGEIRLPDGEGRGAYFGLESEVVFQTSSSISHVGHGATSGFLYLGASGAGLAEFNTYGVFMHIVGLTPGVGELLSLDYHTLKCDLYSGGAHRAKYLVLSLAENYINHSFSAIAANGRIFNLGGSWATPATPDGEGIVNISANVTGIATGEVNLASHWLNLTGAADVPGYMHIHTDGIWGSACDLATAYIAWAKISWMLPEDPGGLYLFELNNGTAHDTLDAIFAVNNPAYALGFIAGTSDDAPTGSIPFMAGAGGGGGLKYIRTYDGPIT